MSKTVREIMRDIPIDIKSSSLKIIYSILLSETISQTTRELLFKKYLDSAKNSDNPDKMHEMILISKAMRLAENKKLVVSDVLLSKEMSIDDKFFILEVAIKYAKIFKPEVIEVLRSAVRILDYNALPENLAHALEIMEWYIHDKYYDDIFLVRDLRNKLNTYTSQCTIKDYEQLLLLATCVSAMYGRICYKIMDDYGYSSGGSCTESTGDDSDLSDCSDGALSLLLIGEDIMSKGSDIQYKLDDLQEFVPTQRIIAQNMVVLWPEVGDCTAVMRPVTHDVVPNNGLGNIDKTTAAQDAQSVDDFFSDTLNRTWSKEFEDCCPNVFDGRLGISLDVVDSSLSVARNVPLIADTTHLSQ